MRSRANHIQSKIADISKLCFNPIPSRPFKVARACSSGKVIVLVGENGKVYSNEVQKWGYWTTIDRMAGSVACLIALGMLSDAAIEQHKAAIHEEYKARELKRAAEALTESLEAAGLQPNVAQKKFMLTWGIKLS